MIHSDLELAITAGLMFCLVSVKLGQGLRSHSYRLPSAFALTSVHPESLHLLGQGLDMHHRLRRGA
eukprot:54672-Eustigmatos_ZCMA.PRE.1